MYLHRIVTDIDDNIPAAEYCRPGGSLLMMVGLPGTGKSSIVESLQEKLSCTVVRTDNVRLQMRKQPTYTAAEMMLVYEVCYSIIEVRLRKGERVIFDASNYLAARRDHLAKVARRCGAAVAVCYVQAAQETIRERLKQRSSGKRRETDLSDADWSVYKWMVEAQEPVVGEHLIVDTTSRPPDVLGAELKNYWLECERKAEGDLNLQSESWDGGFNKANITHR